MFLLGRLSFLLLNMNNERTRKVSGGINCHCEMQARDSLKILPLIYPFVFVWLLLERLLLDSALTDLWLEDVFSVMAGRQHGNIKGIAGNRIIRNLELL